jgi:hypothetical protein
VSGVCLFDGKMAALGRSGAVDEQDMARRLIAAGWLAPLRRSTLYLERTGGDCTLHQLWRRGPGAHAAGPGARARGGAGRPEKGEGPRAQPHRPLGGAQGAGDAGALPRHAGKARDLHVGQRFRLARSPGGCTSCFWRCDLERIFSRRARCPRLARLFDRLSGGTRARVARSSAPPAAAGASRGRGPRRARS